MFLLSALVRRSGMKVVLTGEGADEFLAGYDVFKEDRVRRFWARRPESEMRPALLARLHPYVAGAQQTGAMWKEFFRAGLTETTHRFYSHRPRWDGLMWGLRFLSPEARSAAGAVEAEVASLMPPGWEEWDPTSRAQSVEAATFMSPYLLCAQGDRVAMGHSVETRYPFLDPDVIDYCTALPRGFKMRGLRDKVALRALASRSLPEEVWTRRKWPYRAPIAGALFGAGAPEWVREQLAPAALGRSGLIDAGAGASLASRFVGKPGRMAEREEMALLGLLTLQVLEQAMVRELPGRIASAEAKLAGTEPDIFEDKRRAALRSTA
jgi:asparagine synthase (glutamine-hydrolysing)